MYKSNAFKSYPYQKIIFQANAFEMSATVRKLFHVPMYQEANYLSEQFLKPLNFINHYIPDLNSLMPHIKLNYRIL